MKTMQQIIPLKFDKKFAFFGALVLIIGIIAGFLLVQQRLTTQRQASGFSCPDNRGQIDCFFEYKTYDGSGYSATLRNEEGIVVGEKSGALPNTNGEVANETAPFPLMELGKKYTCTVKITTSCKETKMTSELIGENTCNLPDSTPTPTVSQSGCQNFECACKDIIDSVVKYPTYYPRQPGIEDGEVRIFPKTGILNPGGGQGFCTNCSKIEMKDKKTGKLVFTFPTATPDPNNPGANACIDENGKDIGKDFALDGDPAKAYGYKYRCHQGDATNSENGCREYTIEMTNTTKTLACTNPADEPLPSKDVTCGLECKSCCPVCTDPQPMIVEAKKCSPKPGMPNPQDHPGDPAYWICEIQEGESCSAGCNIDFTSPAIDNYNPPGFRGEQEEPPVNEPGRGYPNNDPDKITPACVSVGQNVVIRPIIDDTWFMGKGTINWDEFDFGTGKPKPTEPARLTNSHGYTDPGTYDVKLFCPAKNGDLEICTKRIAITCNNPPSGGGGGGGGGGNPPGGGNTPSQCYDKCTANTDCATGMTCHAIPGAGYSRCVKNPDNSCADDKDCLCKETNSCPLPKQITGACI